MELSSISIAITSLVGALFSPGAIFTTGVSGAWYDPSDFSTLFQDAAGTTPVTAVGQPVGLMLDKSKGLVLGPELVTNGTFDSNINEWTPLPGVTASRDTSIFPSGALKIQVTSFGATYVSQSLGSNFIVGRKYKATATVYTSSSTPSTEGAAISFVGSLFAATTSVAQSQKGTAQTITIYFTATSTTHSIYLAICTLDFQGWGSVGSVAYFDNISVRELPGNHAFNPSGNSANFPVLQQDGTGRYYLAFNGVNQWLQTNSIDFTYGDKMFVAAGVRKLSNQFAVLTEIGSSATTINSSFHIASNYNTTTYDYAFGSRGTAYSEASSTYVAAPVTSIVSGVGNISASSATLRSNGSQVAQSTATQGTGNYGNYPLYIGARAGTSLFFNGRLYGLVVAGKAASVSEIASTEAWLNQKTGAY